MAKVNIITGRKQAGKTTFLLKKIVELRNNGNKICGIIARGTFSNNTRHRFYVHNVETKEEQLLMSSDAIINADKIGRFFIRKEAFNWGTDILKESIKSDCKIIVLDEIGRFELKEKGWANILSELIDSNKQLYLVIRKEWVNEIIAKYNITDYKIITL